VVSLSGLGGMGKTQLSIHLIRQSGGQYSSVFWLNAKDENTLKAGLAALAIEVTGTSASLSVSDTHEEGRLVQQVRQWLSQQGNDKWLIVYDNYDDPRLPGIDSNRAACSSWLGLHTTKALYLYRTRARACSHKNHKHSCIRSCGHQSLRVAGTKHYTHGNCKQNHRHGRGD
jgi:hypothetical protein